MYNKTNVLNNFACSFYYLQMLPACMCAVYNVNNRPAMIKPFRVCACLLEWNREWGGKGRVGVVEANAIE